MGSTDGLVNDNDTVGEKMSNKWAETWGMGDRGFYSDAHYNREINNVPTGERRKLSPDERAAEREACIALAAKQNVWPGDYKDIRSKEQFDKIMYGKSYRGGHNLRKSKGYGSYWWTYGGMRAWIERGEKPDYWQIWQYRWFQFTIGVLVVLGAVLASGGTGV